MRDDVRAEGLTAWQQFLLVLLRFTIGWHLFYQGLGKLQSPHWSAEGYLRAATGPLAALFQKMAASGAWLALADRATVWGLIVLGMLLMVGLFTRPASAGAILLLALFYAAQPPLPAHGFAARTPDGSELYANKVTIEILALLVALAFDTGRISGLDLLVRQWFARRRAPRAGGEVAAATQDS